MEAVIGAAYLSGGREVALWAAKRLNIAVTHIDTWTNFGTKTMPPFLGDMETFPQDSLDAIEEIVGYKFPNRALIVQALVRAECANCYSHVRRELTFHR
jgi:endoribonuclease Dicer